MVVAAEAATAQLSEIRSGSANVTSPIALVDKIGNNHVAKAFKKGVRYCHWCGGQHMPETCRFNETECNYCRKMGHLERMRLQRKKQQ